MKGHPEDTAGSIKREGFIPSLPCFAVTHWKENGKCVDYWLYCTGDMQRAAWLRRPKGEKKGQKTATSTNGS